MTKAILILLAMFTAQAHAEVFKYEAIVQTVVDGDTVKVRINEWPEPLREVLVRVDGIDTPEKGERAKCAKEAGLGAMATDYAKTLTRAGEVVTVYFDTTHRDKFGRVLSDVIFKDGKKWSALMIGKGLAREYHGEAKSDWCN